MNRTGRPNYRYCIVPNCKNTVTNAPDKIYFPVPRDMKIRKQWCDLMKRKDNTLSSTSCLYCCEDHFDVEKDALNYSQYKIMTVQNGEKVTLRLKKDAIPHRFECQENLCLKKGDKVPRRLERKKYKRTLFKKKRAQSKDDIDEIGELDLIVPRPSKEPSDTDITVENIIAWEGYPSQKMSQTGIADSEIKEEYESDSSTEQPYINLTDCEIKIEDDTYSGTEAVFKDIVSPKNLIDKETGAGVSDIVDIADSENELDYKIDHSTEHPNLDAMNTEDNVNCEVLSVNVPRNIRYNMKSGRIEENFDNDKKFRNLMHICMFACIEREPKMLLGLRKTSIHFIKHVSEKLSLPTVNIIITLKKIKLNEAFSILALQFGCKQTTICRIFSNSVTSMARKMKELIQWPTPSMILSKLPISFRDTYPNVVSIIDCFEIEFEKPANAVNAVLCWSTFKKCHTFKFLVSYTPDGFITFISRGFSGGATDDSVVAECGFLDHLPPNQEVMADERFKNLSCLLKDKNCSLVPLPLISTTTSTIENVRQISRHIERLRYKLREFNILLPACFDNTLIPVLDDIVVVACGLINVQHGKYNMRSL